MVQGGKGTKGRKGSKGQNTSQFPSYSHSQDGTSPGVRSHSPASPQAQPSDTQPSHGRGRGFGKGNAKGKSQTAQHTSSGDQHYPCCLKKGQRLVHDLDHCPHWKLLQDYESNNVCLTCKNRGLKFLHDFKQCPERAKRPWHSRGRPQSSQQNASTYQNREQNRSGTSSAQPRQGQMSSPRHDKPASPGERKSQADSSSYSGPSGPK